MNEDGQNDGVNVTSLDGTDTGAEGEGRSFIADTSAGTPVERKIEPLHLKTRPIPAIVTLLGGGIVAAVVFIQQLEFRKSLLLILASLVVFLISGEIVKVLLDRIELPNPEAVDADGNVIQKGKSGDDSEEDAEDSGLSSENSGG